LKFYSFNATRQGCAGLPAALRNAPCICIVGKSNNIFIERQYRLMHDWKVKFGIRFIFWGVVSSGE
jgi:hypothetical protein